MKIRGPKWKIMPKKVAQTHFGNFPSWFLEFIPGFFREFLKIPKTSDTFLDHKKCPEKKVLGGVSTGKIPNFHHGSTPEQVVRWKSDFGQKPGFAVFGIFEAQPIEHASRFWRQIDGLDVLHPQSEFCLRATLGKKVTAKNVISLLGEHHFY